MATAGSTSASKDQLGSIRGDRRCQPLQWAISWRRTCSSVQPYDFMMLSGARTIVHRSAHRSEQPMVAGTLPRAFLTSSASLASIMVKVFVYGRSNLRRVDRSGGLDCRRLDGRDLLGLRWKSKRKEGAYCDDELDHGEAS
jgi:hypothetical protein